MNFRDVTRPITNPVLKRVAYVCVLGLVLFALIGALGLVAMLPSIFWFGVVGSAFWLLVAFIAIVIDVLIEDREEGTDE